MIKKLRFNIEMRNLYFFLVTFVNLTCCTFTHEPYEGLYQREVFSAVKVGTVASLRIVENFANLPENAILDVLSLGNSFCCQLILGLALMAISLATYMPTLLVYFKFMTLPFSPVVSTLILSTLSSLPIALGILICIIKQDKVDYAIRFAELILSIFLPLLGLLKDAGIVSMTLLYILVYGISFMSLMYLGLNGLPDSKSPHADKQISLFLGYGHLIFKNFLIQMGSKVLYGFAYLGKLVPIPIINTILHDALHTFGALIELPLEIITPAFYIMSPLLVIIQIIYTMYMLSERKISLKYRF